MPQTPIPDPPSTGGDIAYRTAADGEAAFIVEMARLAGTIEDRPLPDAEDPAVQAVLPGSLDAVVVAIRAGRAIGAAWWHWHAPPLLVTADPVPEMIIAVTAEHRGQGVGSGLINALADRAASRFESLTLNVHLRNPAARLYMRTGFIVAGRGRGWFGVAMSRDLRSGEGGSVAAGPPDHLRLDYPVPPLTDGVALLREWQMRDLECVRQASADVNIVADTTVPASYTAEAGRAYVERQWSRRTTGAGVSMVIASAVTDEPLGQLYLAIRPQAYVVGLGYWIVPSARRRGWATRAAALASAWTLRTAGAARVEAWAATENTASQRTLGSAGFTREGTLRSFWAHEGSRGDMVVYSRIAADLPDAG